MNIEEKTFIIVRAGAEDAAALLEYQKIVGGETDNLNYGAEGASLSPEAMQARLREQTGPADHVRYLAKANGEIIGTASLNRRHKRMNHRGDFGISVKRAWWGQRRRLRPDGSDPCLRPGKRLQADRSGGAQR